MFKACIKKEFLDELRTKRFFKFCLFSVGMVIFTMIMFGMMTVVSRFTETYTSIEGGEMVGMLQELFQLTFQNSSMYFASFMVSYFTIIYMIMIMNLFGKEITQNKWLLPISAGISTKDMILSKILVKTLSLIISVIIAIVLHFLLTIIFFSPTATFGYGQLWLAYLGLILLNVFLVTLILTLNAITKKGWLGITVGLCLIIIGTLMLQSIKVGNTTLITYTPLVFYEIVMNPTITLNALQVSISMVTYALVLVGLVVWAVFSNKIKPNKNA